MLAQAFKKATIPGSSIELESTTGAYLMPVSSRVEKFSEMGFDTQRNTYQYLQNTYFYVESVAWIEPVPRGEGTLKQ